MSSEAEFTGRTVAQAIEKACQQLEIKEEKLKFDIVSKGSTGIFGIVGAKKSRIKVYLKEKQTQREPVKAAKKDAPEDGETLSSGPDTLTLPASAGKAALEKIAEGITADISVSTTEERNRISYNIAGGRAGLLIGKRGQTLEAIQYLVEKVVNRNSQARLRVSIDVGGYQAKKRKNLVALAERTAQKAKKNGRPAAIGQLNAHDRRIVHLALKEDSEVITKSVGNGFLRKLVVLPKKRRSGRNNNP